MVWTNSIRAVVTSLTSQFPAIVSPLNTEPLDQANFADGIGKLSTAIDSLRNVSWYGDDLWIQCDNFEVVGVQGEPWTGPVVSGAVTTSTSTPTYVPTYVQSSTSAVTGSLACYVPQPSITGIYLKGYEVMSEHAISGGDTGHSAIPAEPFRAVLVEATPTGYTTLDERPAAATSSVADYDAAQEYDVELTTHQQLNNGARRKILLLIGENGVNSRATPFSKRTVRGVRFNYGRGV